MRAKAKSGNTRRMIVRNTELAEGLPRGRQVFGTISPKKYQEGRKNGIQPRHGPERKGVQPPKEEVQAGTRPWKQEGLEESQAEGRRQGREGQMGTVLQAKGRP